MQVCSSLGSKVLLMQELLHSFPGDRSRVGAEVIVGHC